MNTQRLTQLENKIEHLVAFTAASSMVGFQDLNTDMQHTYLDGLHNMTKEIQQEFQQVIETAKIK